MIFVVGHLFVDFYKFGGYFLVVLCRSLVLLVLSPVVCLQLDWIEVVISPRYSTSVDIFKRAIDLIFSTVSLLSSCQLHQIPNIITPFPVTHTNPFFDPIAPSRNPKPVSLFFINCPIRNLNESSRVFGELINVSQLSLDEIVLPFRNEFHKYF